MARGNYTLPDVHMYPVRKNMKNLLIRLSSRKFLLALSAFIFCVAHSNVPGATAVVLGYLGVNGFVSGSGSQQ